MFFQAFKGSDSGGYAAPSDGYGKVMETKFTGQLPQFVIIIAALFMT